MSNYLRQLRNDEKRCAFSLVGTIDSKFPTSVDATPIFVIPINACVTRIYAVVKEAFAAGSTLEVAIYDGTLTGTALFTALPLDVVGAVISPETDAVGAVLTDQSVNVTANQAAVDSAVGSVQIVVEFTEEPVKTGSYTR